MIDKVDEMIIGGGMAFTFLKKLNNMKIGSSLFDEEGFKAVDEIMAKAKAKGVKIHLPVDFISADKFSNDANTAFHTIESGIPDKWLGLDAYTKSIDINRAAVKRAKLIVWNGPQGCFEMDKFKGSSFALLKDVIEQTKNGATSIVGGGDTVNLVNSQKGAAAQMSHVSTGGGASLELLEGKTLPGVEFLSNIEDLK